MIKILLYTCTIPLVIWGVESININAIFKKNRHYQARIVYMMIIFSLSYLVVNFLDDLIGVIKF